jgi:hypothetical protein
MQNDVLFDGEKALRTNDAGLTDFAALTITFVQWDGESIPVRAARDLAQNQNPDLEDRQSPERACVFRV